MTYGAPNIPNPKVKASNGINILATDSEGEEEPVKELVKRAYL